MLTNNIYAELTYFKRDHLINNKLEPDDILRLANKITTSLFDEYNCCNYLVSQRRYKVFHFKNKKINILRLLYHNYVGELHHTEYLKRKCNNVNCINIKHLEKKKKVYIQPLKPEQAPANIIVDPPNFTVSFD